MRISDWSSDVCSSDLWKRIESLREAGVAIQAQPGRGYALAQPVDLLDADAIVMAMPDSARARLTGLEIVWSIDSTNSELLRRPRSDEHTSELQSLMRISYAVFCLKQNNTSTTPVHL